MSAGDREIEDYLSGDSEISRRYRSVVREEPPEDLDRAILARARSAAVQPSAADRFRRLSIRRFVPLALAATVVLTFAIVREAGLDSGLMLREAATPAQAPQETSSLPRAADIPHYDPARASEPLSKQLPTQEAAQNTAGAIAAPRPAPAPETRMEAAKRARPAEAPPVDVLRDAESVRARQSFATSRAAADASALVSAPASAEPRPEGKKEEKAAVKVQTPEIWLDGIRKLRAEGRQVEAEAELRHFLEAYPDYFKKNPNAVRP